MTLTAPPDLPKIDPSSYTPIDGVGDEAAFRETGGIVPVREIHVLAGDRAFFIQVVGDAAKGLDQAPFVTLAELVLSRLG